MNSIKLVELYNIRAVGMSLNLVVPKIQITSSLYLLAIFSSSFILVQILGGEGAHESMGPVGFGFRRPCK